MSTRSPAERQTRLIICCGVSGSGKTTLAEHLAQVFDLDFVEADDFHPAENKARMASGKPLTDAMREPWMIALCEHLGAEFRKGRSCVMAHSGLRWRHRERFRKLGASTLFLFLSGSKAVIRERLERRTGHYMKPGLLDSQFEALESPLGEQDVTPLDIEQSVEEMTKQADEVVRTFLSSAEQKPSQIDPHRT